MTIKTVLFVDDELSTLNTLKRMFRNEDYQVLTAASGAEGLDILETTHVDLVVSDQRMPGMTGAEFLKQVSQHYPHTIRMIMSGYADIEAVIDAVNKGNISRFLTKPWNGKELKQTIGNWLAKEECCLDTGVTEVFRYQQLMQVILDQDKEIGFLKGQLHDQLHDQLVESGKEIGESIS